MTFSIPALKLYDGAENLSQQMHNLLPVRGAKVRDALRWSNYMDQALVQTQGAEIYIGSQQLAGVGQRQHPQAGDHAP